MIYDLTGKTIWVAGHRGMVGSALLRRLSSEPCRVVTVDRAVVDLRRPEQLEPWLAATRPQVAVVAAATVGGIHANSTRPADFIHDNLTIAATVIEAARKAGVEKLLYLGSSCAYPRLAPQPIAEEALLTGPLEPTNAWYAVAKIAGVTLCQAYRRQYGCDFIAAMPTNLYGPGDTFDEVEGHVLPSLMARMHRARLAGAPEVVVWGTGTPRREFLHVDDASDACLHLLRHYGGETPVNVGAGRDVTIAEAAALVAEAVGYRGRIVFDPNRPDGTPRKLLDTSRLGGLGWQPRTDLRAGLAETYAWYLRNEA